MANNAYKIVIKSINQLFSDETIECEKNWSFKQLKAYIADKKSDKLFVENRLIHSQRLIRDEELLKNVFTQYSESAPPVLYVAPPPPPSTFEPPTTLRKRNLNDTSTPKPTTTNQTAPNIPAQNLSNPYSYYPANSYTPFPTPPSTFPFHPSLYASLLQNPSLFQGVLPQAMFGMDSGVTNRGGVGGGGEASGGGGVYSVEQMTWMQQMYYHYLNQYMHLYQNPGDQNAQLFNAAFITSTPPPLQPPQQQQQPAHQQPPEPQQAAINGGGGGGGGGAFLMEEEDDGRRRDWLDWSYATLRFFMLMCILYFYSTPARFITFVVFSVLLLVFQMGWVHRLFVMRFFGARPQQQLAPQPAQQPQQPEQQQEQPEQAENLQPDEQQQQPQDAQQPQHRSPFSIICSFIIGFFTSLAPQIPPPINNN